MTLDIKGLLLVLLTRPTLSGTEYKGFRRQSHGLHHVIISLWEKDQAYMQWLVIQKELMEVTFSLAFAAASSSSLLVDTPSA